MMPANLLQFLGAMGAFLVLAGAVLPDTGEPGCKTAAEVGHNYRNFVDPTRYWYCAAQNTKAVSRRCPPETGFDQDLGHCIPWIDWKWKPTRDPPSRPNGWKPSRNIVDPDMSAVLLPEVMQPIDY